MKARDRWMRGRGRDCFRLVLISRDGKMIYWNVIGEFTKYRVGEADFYFDVHVFMEAISWFWDGSIFYYSSYFLFHFFFRGNSSFITSPR